MGLTGGEGTQWILVGGVAFLACPPALAHPHLLPIGRIGRFIVGPFPTRGPGVWLL